MDMETEWIWKPKASSNTFVVSIKNIKRLKFSEKHKEYSVGEDKAVNNCKQFMESGESHFQLHHINRRVKIMVWGMFSCPSLSSLIRIH